MRLPIQPFYLLRRQNNPPADPPPQNNRNLVIIAISVLAAIIVGVVIYALLRLLCYRQASPKYIPTQFLKRAWRRWMSSGSGSGKYSRTSRDSGGLPTVYSGSNALSTQDAIPGVDRHTSIRSVVTLPAYKPTARETERVLGREGERGGIDVVIEFPETAEEEETRRDEDMEAMYQVRLLRRVEAQQREERRRRRREAREQGDTATLEAMRRESRARARERAASAASTVGQTNRPNVHAPSGSTVSLPVSTLSVENATRLERERRISSVSYAAVGLARHDGSRVRASSDSERPLLDAAAPMSSRSISPLANSHMRRDSSTHSISTTGSGSERRGSAASDDSEHPPRIVIPRLRPRTAEDSEHSHPPGYEDVDLAREEAPPYESPVASRAPLLPEPRILILPNGLPQLPEMRPLPAIEITSYTPSHSNPASPVGRTNTS